MVLHEYFSLATSSHSVHNYDFAVSYHVESSVDSVTLAHLCTLHQDIQPEFLCKAHSFRPCILYLNIHGIFIHHCLSHACTCIGDFKLVSETNRYNNGLEAAVYQCIHCRRVWHCVQSSSNQIHPKEDRE